MVVKSLNLIRIQKNGSIDKKEAINRLRYEKPNLQVCLRSTKALDCLVFERSELV